MTKRHALIIALAFWFAILFDITTGRDSFMGNYRQGYIGRYQ